MKHATADITVYRVDIDGLRALAVLPVVLFHAHVPGFDGGYVGVDVFFVISGYLITQLLARRPGDSMSAGLKEFYLRRARRILPALTAMLVVASAVAAWVLLSWDLERFGKFLTLSAVFLGNFAAWSSGGYFDQTAGELVHLWSIGIEEQFYLAFPLMFLFLVRRTPRALGALLWIFAAMSLALCLWSARPHPNTTFYAPVTRAWELLIGAAVAYAGWSGFANRRVNEAAAACALLALVVCVAWFDPETLHPGPATLVPCMATLLLLGTAATRSTAVSRLLALRPLVFTGLISYSIYLWHVPVLNLASFWTIKPLSTTQLVLLLLVTYAIAAASWRWVEQPLRRREWLRSNRRFCAVFLLATIGLVLVGLVFWRSHGLPQRLSAEVRMLAARPPPIAPEVARCMRLEPELVARGGLCSFGTEGAARSLVLWGDSHALMVLPAFRALRDPNTQLYFAGRSSCRPLPGLEPDSAWWRNDQTNYQCARFNQAMIEAITRLRPEAVVLSGYWNMPELVEPGSPAQAELARVSIARALDSTLEALAPSGAGACAVLDAPILGQVAPYALAMAHRRGIPADWLSHTRAAAFAQQSVVDGIFGAAQAQGRIAVLDPKLQFCAGERCRVLADSGRPLYIDNNHISAEGSRLLIAPLAQCIAEAARQRAAR